MGPYLNLVLYVLLLNNLFYLEIKCEIRTPLDPAEPHSPIKLTPHLGFNGVSRQKSAALYHRGEGVAPISKIPPPPPSPSLSSPFFSPNPQRNLTLPAPLAVSSPTLLTLSLYSPTSVIGPDLGQGNFPLSLDSRCRKARDTRRRKARDTRRRKARDTRY